MTSTPLLISIKNFLHMGGYAFYVFSAYGVVCFFLAFTWFSAWRRWQRSKRNLILDKNNMTSPLRTIGYEQHS